MCSTGRLSITRKKRILAHNGLLKIFVDETNIGQIANGHTKIFDLMIGSHEVYVKMGFYRSAKKKILIKENQQINMVTDMARGGLVFHIAPLLVAPIVGFKIRSFFILCEEQELIIKGIPHIFEIVTEKKL